MIFQIFILRLWLAVAAFLFVIQLAQFVFNPSKKKFKELISAVPFILFWPLALFHPKGRKQLFKRLSKI